MEGKVCKHTGVNFIFLILTISGGFRLVLTETKSLKNVSESVGTNVVIKCRSETLNSTDQPSWFKYDHGKILIYNASSSSNSNSSKYLVRNGNKTLTVMNAEWSDAVTYCCNVGGVDDYCANVVLLGSQTLSVSPTDRAHIAVGDTVNITCFLSYNLPSSDLDAPFPLSDDQVPMWSMFAGEEEISRELVVDVATVPHSKTISANKTFVVADLDRYLECRLSSTEPSYYTGTLQLIAAVGIIVIFPNNETSFRGVYSVNDVFQCFPERFPFLSVTWTDVTAPSTPRIISTGIGNATAKVLAAGKYVWTCSTASPLKITTASRRLTFLVSAGAKITLPILLTSGCMVVIALIVF